MRLVLLSPLLVFKLLLSCGGVGQEAPPPPEPEELLCEPMGSTLSSLFEMLHDPREPLSALREVVLEISELSTEECRRRERLGMACYHPVGAILDAVVRGFVTFARDPDESADNRCLPVPPDEGENRLCSLRRALDFGVRDAGAVELFEQLIPMFSELLGWVSNEGPGADGRAHFELLEVVRQAAAAPGICQPAQLLDVVDELLYWWRPDSSCQQHADGENCRALAALGLLRSLVSDPALQEFLQLFESEDGSGRVAFIRLVRLLMAQMTEMPEDEHYFDAVDRLSDEFLFPFLDREPERYGPLREKLAASIGIAREFLDPSRERPVLAQFKGVVRCFYIIDEEEMHLVGAVYDLLLSSGGSGKLDLVELVTLLEDVVRLDSQRNGVFLGAIQTMVQGSRDDEQGTEAMRQLLVELFSSKNIRQLLPPLRLMIDRGVLTELVYLVDDLLYGCRQQDTMP